MTQFEETGKNGRSAWSAPLVVAYTLLCAASLVVTGALVSQRHGMVSGVFSIALVMVGVVTLAARSNLGPILVIGLVAIAAARGPRYADAVADLGIVIGTLAAVVAHCRARTLVDRADPAGARRSVLESLRRRLRDGKKAAQRTAPQGLPPRPLTAAELGTFLALLAVWPVLAAVVWQAAPAITAVSWRLFAHPRVWDEVARHRGWGTIVSLLWTIGLVAVVARLSLSLARAYRMTPLEAEALLNDVVWRDLRREGDHIGKVLGRRERRYNQSG